MTTTNKVVAKFVDGRIIKGHTSDFYKSRPFFHMTPLGSEKPVKMLFEKLKAVFFVKTFEGRKFKLRRLTHVPIREQYGRKVKIRFNDGEEIEGFIQTYKPSEPVFLLIPDDPTGNNVRIFCIHDAVDEIIWLTEEKETTSKVKKKKKIFHLKDYF